MGNLSGMSCWNWPRGNIKIKLIFSNVRGALTKNSKKSEKKRSTEATVPKARSDSSSFLYIPPIPSFIPSFPLFYQSFPLQTFLPHHASLPLQSFPLPFSKHLFLFVFPSLLSCSFLPSLRSWQFSLPLRFSLLLTFFFLGYPFLCSPFPCLSLNIFSFLYFLSFLFFLPPILPFFAVLPSSVFFHFPTSFHLFLFYQVSLSLQSFPLPL